MSDSSDLGDPDCWFREKQRIEPTSVEVADLLGRGFGLLPPEGDIPEDFAETSDERLSEARLSEKLYC